MGQPKFRSVHKSSERFTDRGYDGDPSVHKDLLHSLCHSPVKVIDVFGSTRIFPVIVMPECRNCGTEARSRSASHVHSSCQGQKWTCLALSPVPIVAHQKKEGQGVQRNIRGGEVNGGDRRTVGEAYAQMTKSM